jgi:phosphonopyruvate decarboxylase
MLSREAAIQEIFNKHGESSVYVTNTGYISRAVHTLFPNNKNIFYMQGSMGLAPCIGLGIAKNCEKDVVVISGDGALLMHLGITHTIHEENLSNLHTYVLDNGCHESVGAYKCAEMQSSYPGINKIYKISNDGKCERVSVTCVDNTKNVKDFLNEK